MYNSGLALLVMGFLAVSLLSFCSCSKKEDGRVVCSGPEMDDSTRVELAVYYLPTASGDPMEVLREVLVSYGNGPKLVAELPDTVTEAVVWAEVLDNVKVKYRAPSVQFLQTCGRGLSEKEVSEVQDSEQAFILRFAHPRNQVWNGLRDAYEIVERVAKKTGGLAWDEETRELFSVPEWKQKRIMDWPEEVPNIKRHITIHCYRTGEYARSITLGMVKFGLPDVVVEEHSVSNINSVMGLINLVCQSFLEGQKATKRGDFDLAISSIKNGDVRDEQLESLKANAEGSAELRLVVGTRDEGDAENRLIEISFDRYSAPDRQSKQEASLGRLFGWEDENTMITHTEEVLAASERAKSKLPELRKLFLAGLRPGELILVKAPFSAPDGQQEWMWVEVSKWQEGVIKGTLQNEPFSIPSLKCGQVVEVQEADVFDYMRVHPDGRQDGNETGEVIQRMQDEE